MNETITVDRGGLDLLPEAQPLWEALYDRHLEYAAAGRATIAREDSWPRRLAHYQRIFATHSHPVVFLARLDGEAIGYALGYEEELLGEPAVVLETLSLVRERASRRHCRVCRFELGTKPGPDDTWVSSESLADLTVLDNGAGETPPDVTALREFFQLLEAAELWSIHVTMPTFTGSDRGRDALTLLGLTSALERLTRPI